MATPHALDEGFTHQLPMLQAEVALEHPHWRESYFFDIHDPSGEGDVVFFTMARYPSRGRLDSLQMGRVGGEPLLGPARSARRADDPHTTEVAGARVEVVDPWQEVRLWADPATSAIGLDLTFRARTQPYGLRRGTMRAGDEIIWDQRHILQSGTYHGTYTVGGVDAEVDGWVGQRDHSWGIRDHGRCPLWIWFQIQLDDGFLGVWHWELANGARVYTDGCWAGTDGSEPVPVVDFQHDVAWVGRRRQARRRTASTARRSPGLTGTCRVHAGGRAHDHRGGRRHLRPPLRAVPPGRPEPDAGPHRRRPRGHRDLRGHRRPPPPLLPRHHRPGPAPRMTRPADRRHTGRPHARVAHRRAAPPAGTSTGRPRHRRGPPPARHGPDVRQPPRWRCTYDGADRRRRPTLVAKLPAADPTSRSHGGVAAQLREGGPLLPAARAAPADARRRPSSTPTSTRHAGAFVLLLEDLAPAEQGDQLAGCTVGAGRARGRRAGRSSTPPAGAIPTLADLEWLHGDREASRAFMAHAAARCSGTGSGALRRRPRRRTSATAGEALFAHLERYLTPDRRARDRRPRRLPPRQPARSTPTAAAVRRRRRLADLRRRARPCTTSPTSSAPACCAEDRRAVEERPRARTTTRDLRGRRRHGVLDWDQCWRDYRRGTFAGLLMAVAASMLVERTDRGDQMFLTMASRHAAHALDLEAIDLL